MANLPNYPQTEPFTFLGLENQEYDSSKVVILPVPYSSTTYWKSGTKDGPRAIIEASRHLELWDEELKQDSSTLGIYTMGEVQVSKNSPKETIDRVAEILTKVQNDNKFPIILGGEHSLALPGAMAAAQKYKNLSVLQFDAHTDSRFEFEDTLYSHACTMRRVVEDLKIPVTHVGIRSHSEEEAEFFKKSKLNKIFYAPEIPVNKILATLKKNVYVTFDLDAFDTSIMPAVGTPEPGGIGWYETLALIKKVAQKHTIVGADIVELDPIPGQSASDFTAAKLAYKIIGYKFN